MLMLMLRFMWGILESASKQVNPRRGRLLGGYGLFPCAYTRSRKIDGLERVTKGPSAVAGCERRRLRLRAKRCLSVPQRARLKRLFTLHPSRLRSRLSLATKLILLHAPSL